MKIKAGFIAVKVNNIVYDQEFVADDMRLPKMMTIEANEDILDGLVDDSGEIDVEETTKYIGDLIEEKIGVLVMSFKWFYTK